MLSSALRIRGVPRQSRSLGLNIGTTVVVLIIFLLVPQVVNDTWLRTLTEALLFAYYAQCWNLSAGFTGMFSLAHPVFTAAGGYTSALLLINQGVSPWIGMLAGAVLAAAIGAAIAVVTSRIGISGIYFALFTMALWTVVTAIASVWGLLGQNAGLLIPPKGGLLDFNTSSEGYYYIIFGFVIVCALLTYKLLHSRLGLSFLAYRDDPDAARASGVAVMRTQVATIAISAFMTAFAGAFYAMYFRFISPADLLGFSITQYMILGTMVGGICTVRGPIIGGLAFGVLGNELRTLSFLSGGSKGDVFTTGVYAVLLILTVRFLPGGLTSLAGVTTKQWSRMRNAQGRKGELANVHEGSGADAEASLPDLPERTAARSHTQREFGEPILLAEQLTVQIGGLRALDGVDVRVSAGEVLGIIGPNGAGKTTLFNCLTGFMTPTSGTATFEGRDIVGAPPSALCRRGLGRTFQIAKPFPAMSALDAVAVAARLYTGSYREARESAAETLSQVDFKASHDTLGADLSNVNRKRLEVARALAGRPRLLLLDEVCAGLSIGEVEDFIEVLHSIADSGIAVLMVEHVLAAVIALADRVQVLDYGRTIAEGLPGEVMKSEVVAEAYLGSSASARRLISMAGR